MVPRVLPSSPEAALIMNLGHSLPICLCVVFPLRVFINHTWVTFACLTAYSPTWFFFFTPHCFASTSVWKPRVPRSCWWQVLCCPQSLPHQAAACHCHPSCRSASPESPGEDIPEVELLTHRALQPPAGLACANLFCRASARVHTGHLGGVWPSTFSRVLTVVTFQCSPNRFVVWWGLTLIFTPLISVHWRAVISPCFWISSLSEGRFLNSVPCYSCLPRCLLSCWVFCEEYFVLRKILNFVLV